MDDLERAYEQAYGELLAVVARLDALRRRGGRQLEPLANAAMYAASHAAWSLWHGLNRGVVPPVFRDRGNEYLELARDWSEAGRAAPDAGGDRSGEGRDPGTGPPAVTPDQTFRDNQPIR
ncbi:hypothetical protein ACFXKG_40340 [Streptomyces sp. NPDC059255]|uniref:hypothetical protein n=1 Tax=Streptomyces sp. NPDC059255 TaxID=3346793 RepID=UPI00369E26E4